MPRLLRTVRAVILNLMALAGLGLFVVSIGHVLRPVENPVIPRAESVGTGAEGSAPEEVDARPIVILDAGHGGVDGGTVAGGSLEKQLNLQTARRVAERLEKAGIRVIFTRDDDSYLKLKERAVLANKTPGALFVSIHHNASTSEQPHGVETYFTQPKPSSVEYSQRRLLGVKADEQFVDRRGEELAMSIQRSFCGATGALDRGVKNRPLALTRWVSCPAVLVECGFLSNPAERRKLADGAYREKMSEGIASGIIAFLEKRAQDPLFAVELPDRDARSEVADIQPES